MKRFTALLLSATMVLGSVRTAAAEEINPVGTDEAVTVENALEEAATDAEESAVEDSAAEESVTEESAVEQEEIFEEQSFQSIFDWELRKENAQELTLANSTEVYLEAGELGLLRFVPEEEDIYYFRSEILGDSYSFDSVATLYDSEGHYLYEDDDGAEGNNFGFNYYLNAGEEYYLEVSDYSQDDPISMKVTVSLNDADAPISFSTWMSDGAKLYGNEYSFGLYVYNEHSYTVEWYFAQSSDPYGGSTDDFIKLEDECDDRLTIELSPDADGIYKAVITAGKRSEETSFIIKGSSIRYERPYSISAEYMKPVTLEAEAESIYGNPLSYRWYCFDERQERDIDFEGADSAIFTVPAQYLKNKYMSIYCEISDGLCSVYLHFPIRVNWFSVHTNPAYSTIVPCGQDTTVGVIVENAPDAELSYHWRFDYFYDFETDTPELTIPAELLSEAYNTHCIQCYVSCEDYTEECTWHLKTKSSLTASAVYEKKAVYGVSSLLHVEAKSAVDHPISYTWYRIDPENGDELIEDADGPDYATDPSDMIRPEVSYYCVVENGSATEYCDFDLTIDYLQSFGSGDVHIKSGEQAILQAYVDENVTGETYTWFEEDEDGSMTELEGETGSSLSVGIGSADSKKIYICRITSGEFVEDVEFRVYSQGSLRTVYSYYHEMASLNETELCVYAFSTRKNAIISYQWQKAVFTDDYGETEYEDIPGANASSYKVRVSELQDINTRYQCVVSDGSQEAYCQMQVDYFPFEYTLADGDGNILPGGTCYTASNEAATVTVHASSSRSGPISYQWQSYEYNESTYEYEYADLAGETSPTFTVSKEEIAERYAQGRRWFEYYCKISCGVFSYQIPVYFYIEDIQYTHGVGWIDLWRGESATVVCDAVSIKGEPLQYQWYYREDDDGERSYILIDGAAEAEYTVDSAMLSPGHHYLFTCVVDAAFLEEPMECSWTTVYMNTQIQADWNYNYFVGKGSNLFLNANAVSLEGKELSYQWYTVNSYGNKTAIPGATDSVYLFKTEDLEVPDEEEAEIRVGCEISDGTDTDYYETRVVVVELAGGIKTGETKKFPAEGTSRYLRFVAEEDASYIFRASGDVETDGELLSSDGRRVASDDISAGNRNFRIKADLHAGEVYYLKVSDYNYVYEMNQLAYSVSCSCAGEDDSDPEYDDSVEYISAYFLDQVVLNPAFEDLPGASYQWWIAKSERYNNSRFYQINGANEATYTTDWTDINGEPLVLTDNSAFIRGCMYDAEGELIDYKTYCVSFQEFHAVADNEGAAVMAEGETRTFTVDVPQTLGKNISYRWLLVSSDSYSVLDQLDCRSNQCAFTMDRSYSFRLRCMVQGDCSSELVDFLIIPDELNEIQSVSLSLLENGNLGLNFYVTGDERLLVSLDGDEPLLAQIIGEDTEAEDLGDRWASQRKYTYKITKELTAGQMADDVTLDLYYGLWEGECYSLDLSYTISVAEYADWILADSQYSEYWPIVRSMINYGTAAQKYFGYNTENPAADQVPHMTAAQKNVKDLTAAQLDGYGRNIPEGAEGLTYYGSSLLLTSETMLRHYFTLEEGYDIFDYGFFADGQALKAVKKGALYCVDVPAGAFGSSANATALTIYTEDAKTTLEYSVRDYIAKAYSCADREFKNLLNTLW